MAARARRRSADDASAVKEEVVDAISEEVEGPGRRISRSTRSSFLVDGFAPDAFQQLPRVLKIGRRNNTWPKRENEYGVYAELRARQENFDQAWLHGMETKWLRPREGVQEATGIPLAMQCCEIDGAAKVLVDAVNDVIKQAAWQELAVIFRQLERYLALTGLPAGAEKPWWELQARSSHSGVAEVVDVSSVPARIAAPAAAAGKRKAPASKAKAVAPGDERAAKLVEFKFSSYDTSLVEAGELTGVMHVPMRQDPDTGLYSLAEGTTRVTIKMDRKDGNEDNFDYDWLDRDEAKKKGILVENKKKKPWQWPKTDWFKNDQGQQVTIGSFSRASGKPIDGFNLGMHLACGYHEERGFQLLDIVPSGAVDGKQAWNYDGSATWDYTEGAPRKYTDPIKFTPFESKADDPLLSKWEANQGGMLVVYAKASLADYFDAVVEGMRGYMDEERVDEMVEDMVKEAEYKIKLYTVLSAHAPDEVPSPKPKKGKAAAGSSSSSETADWAALERVVAARFPSKGKQWVRDAVLEYQNFLQLKIDHEDWDSTQFSPSKMLDEVWHAHLSFVDRYQRDIRALTNGAHHVIEHSPVLGDEARRRYKNAYEAHIKRSAGLIQAGNQAMRAEFWPTPKQSNEHFEEQHDGDSDHGLVPPMNFDDDDVACG